MCGRFNLAYTTSDVAATLPGIICDFWRLPNFNMAPSEKIPTISKNGDILSGSMMQWGIPINTSSGRKVLMSNTRTERLIAQDLLDNSTDRLCFIPATGFYEWAKDETKGHIKTPFNVQIQDTDVFMMVGIWRETSDFSCCSILTCEATGPLSKIHNRSPVIVPKDIELNDRSRDKLDTNYLNWLLDSQRTCEMYLTQVSTRVNSVKYNSYECLSEDTTRQMKLF